MKANVKKINEYPVIKMVTRYIEQFLERNMNDKVVRPGSAEILEGADVKAASLSDVE